MPTALIVIDPQRYFLDPEGRAFLPAAPAILPNVQRLIDAARAHDVPIAYTRHAHRRDAPTGQMGRWWKGKLPWEGEPEGELVEPLQPRADEPVFRKERYSAFAGTGLAEWVAERTIDALVLCGVTTNLCVETTARDAFLRDLQPIVVEDATAAKTPEYHAASLLNLKYGFAKIITTEQFLRLSF